MLKQQSFEKPKEILKEYMSCIDAGDYEKMFSMLSAQSAEAIGEEAFIERNSNIYEGIGAKKYPDPDPGRSRKKRTEFFIAAGWIRRQGRSG